MSVAVQEDYWTPPLDDKEDAEVEGKQPGKEEEAEKADEVGPCRFKHVVLLRVPCLGGRGGHLSSIPDTLDSTTLLYRPTLSQEWHPVSKAHSAKRAAKGRATTKGSLKTRTLSKFFSRADAQAAHSIISSRRPRLSRGAAVRLAKARYAAQQAAQQAAAQDAAAQEV